MLNLLLDHWLSALDNLANLDLSRAKPEQFQATMIQTRTVSFDSRFVERAGDKLPKVPPKDHRWFDNFNGFNLVLHDGVHHGAHDLKKGHQQRGAAPTATSNRSKTRKSKSSEKIF